ncbi:tRNA (cytosine(38)-C(5))-methyltransferase-like isoform X2 [Amphibalanus amphitrite]|uniref:tRNA (cytosine(38)-C(5))-methyltransferase-like isoform X2 n=1 Tax=Amphibalanus amphitrite TaxID=1232801 RepID=UPI001C927944|nr:tRNA (cytosine(38)-C(5))-methyltransferase-like isoform X2 [Amphibalanus amphitrite]
MKLNVLELYSGLGGMHMAMKDCGVPLEVVAAVDINTTANSVYRHNFPSTRHLQRNIQSFSAAELDKLRPDVITMSPPCQPFSRLGLQGDTSDARTVSFLHVLDVLPRLRRPPRYILLENVRGFERSAARDALITTLRQLGLHWRELLLTPSQLGVPNSRSRYYLLARRRPFTFEQPPEGQVLEELPFCTCGHTNNSDSACNSCNKPVLDRLSEYMSGKWDSHDDSAGGLLPPTLGQFLADVAPSDTSRLLLPDKVLCRYGELLDIVRPSSRRSCCLTSGYGHLVEGAGSVLLPDNNSEGGGGDGGESGALDAAFAVARLLPPGDPARADRLRPLQLRWFSPQEAARLMCYPEWFSFPAELTDRQRYKLVGNSVNVRTVAALMLVLMDGESGQSEGESEESAQAGGAC